MKKHRKLGLNSVKNVKKTLNIWKDTGNAEHPFRQAAIHIIEEIIEVREKKGISGQKYYDLEDSLVLILEKEIN